MNGLEEFAVRVEAATGNVMPLLHEIRHALTRLAAGEDELGPGRSVTVGSVIDLRGLPLAPGEEERIEDILGVGEVCAELNALGQTTVQETRVSGVWLVTHHNANDEVVAKFIEVTRIPEILRAQDEDIQHGVDYLNKELATGE